MIEQRGLVDGLQDIALEYANKKAIISETASVTYKELYELSYKYMEYIIELQKGKCVVCVVSKRSISLCACVLGIVQAGGSYMLYEPEDLNEDYLNNISVIGPDLVITDQMNLRIGECIAYMQEIEQRKCNGITTRKREQSDLLYLVNTSGTSDKSKTVMVRDRNLLCYLKGYIQAISINNSDVVLQQSPIYYDGFAEELFSMLLTGGTVVLAETAKLKNPYMIIRLINEYNITILPSTPLMIEEINRIGRKMSLRSIISSGDILRRTQIEQLITCCDVYNMYGLTETTVCATCHKCTKADEENIPIGKAINGYSLVLLDEDGNDVEEMQQGEIYIGGMGVSDGYFLESDSEEKIMTINEERYFRTGDYAWMDKNGEFHYVGRKDRQIKIRGNRVDLGYIENIVRHVDGIESVASFYHTSKRLLCIFFVSEEITEERLRVICDNKLPSYMRANRYICMGKIPMSQTGKIDYKALQSLLDESDNKRGDLDCIESEIVLNLIKIIRNEISNQQAKLEDTWEMLGVDSLAYIRILVKIEEYYSIELGDDLLLQETSATLQNFCSSIEAYLRRKAQNVE